MPRPDRWIEVRPGALARVIETAALHADVVVDVGFGLADDRHQGRDRITLEAIDVADDLVVVGGAEPVSLVRLARGLGGKSFITVTGEISNVKTAIQACEQQLAEQGDIVSTAVVSQPHPQLRDAIL